MEIQSLTKNPTLHESLPPLCSKSVSCDADSSHKLKHALCYKSMLLCFTLAQNFLYKSLETFHT